ncbi:polyprenyl synthetase family protein [Actinokineospora sp. G85]|uniref:polyprenyl synthetase family protein n=1 Tax=Actinokineospora sp. G85 TaxID=3406626 RepID=UPI003C71D034
MTTHDTRQAASRPRSSSADRELVDEALLSSIETLPTPIRRIAEYHCGFRDREGRRLGAGAGKGLRPSLSLMCARAVGRDPEVALPAAVAVQLVHEFSLLHDDVMDGDETRRHRPTAWRVFGVNAAILAGDALLSLAFHVLTGATGLAADAASRRLDEAVQHLIEGQFSDLDFEERSEITLAECTAMAHRKTAALLGTACALGALLAEADTAVVDSLRRFGEHIGLAFQLTDDLLGIWGDPAVTGKPAHSDLLRRKKSFPVVAAMGSGTDAGHALAEIYRQGELGSTEAVRAAELIIEAGGAGWTRQRADEEVDLGLRVLRAAIPGPDDAGELARVAGSITGRDR